jgi:hypothetical protein
MEGFDIGILKNLQLLGCFLLKIKQDRRESICIRGGCDGI